MKKVIIHANVIWTIANFRKNLIKCLMKNGYEVICISDYDDLSDKSEKILKDLNATFIRVKLNRAGINPIEDLKYMYDLYKIYKEVKPDIVISYTIKPNIFGNFVAKALSIPVISTINGLGSGIISDSLISRISKILYRTSLRNAKKVFFQNYDDMDFFISNKLLKKEKTDYIPGSGVNVDEFRNCDSENVLPIKFILIARLLKDKGILEYIEAIKEIKGSRNKEAEFLLAGSFDDDNPSSIHMDQIKEWENAKLITYLGKTDNICEFFKLSDVIVLPSYREGLSRLLLEAASAQKVIVATNVPGCKDIVDDGVNGYLCEVKNSADLAAKMKMVIDMTEKQRMEMGKKGRQKIIKEFDEKIVFSKYLESIQEILG